ncbi:MAG: sulfide/dihydroorotate dehydrogenase-like FAD/NAD-binding protein [Candidatus Omnitrophica bacterium]|nr:sulfide/dihydroorotate dehydrogenase-like FAD/NAD-binding protein [Candidatus Omnitrophota bacterium]
MRIVNKDIISHYNDICIVRLEVSAQDISKKAKPGQFVVLMVCKEGERIPLTIVDNSPEKGTITLIFQEVGLTTKLLGGLREEDYLYSLVGPLGNPTEIKKYGNVILIGGGVGIAEIYPVAKALREEDNYITTILGARTKELLILEKEMEKFSHKFYITTDDGSDGKKGFVTDVLKEILTDNLTYNLIYAVGPIPMMRKVSELSNPYNIKTIVSLNALMVDGTGMCGCCRVNVGDKTKFSCVDGPEFDAHLVDWDNLIKRNSMYLEKEKHICNLLK